MRRKTTFFRTMLLAASLAITGWLPAQTASLEVKQLSAVPGWTGEYVNDVLQDHQGFLWIATWRGLFRYDGYNIKRYSTHSADRSNTLKSSKVSCLFEDSRKRLWVGTSHAGFFRYDPAQDGFIQYAHQPDDMNSLTNDRVLVITEDHQEKIWIGTEKGLNQFDPETESFIHYTSIKEDDRTLSNDYVCSFGLLEDGNLWVGTEQGLNRLVRKSNGDPNYFIRYDLAPPEPDSIDFFRHNFISTILPSTKFPDHLWVGTSIGLKKVKFSNEQISTISYQTTYQKTGEKEGLSHGFVSDLLEQEDALWVATLNGLDRLNLTDRSITTFPAEDNGTAPSNDIVKTLFLDRSQILWVGTSKTLSFINLADQAFQEVSFGPAHNNILSLVPARERKGLWAASATGGLSFVPLTPEGKVDKAGIQKYRFRNVEYEELVDFASDVILDNDGWIWMATHGAGVIRIKESELPARGGVVLTAEQFTKSNGLLQDDYVMSLLESRNGDVWIGYWDNGLSRYARSDGSFQHFSYSKDFAVNFQEFPIVHLQETTTAGGEYSLWVGNREGGVYQLRYLHSTGELAVVRQLSVENNKLSNNAVNCFYFDGTDKVWIGTEYGLDIYDLTKDTTLTYFMGKNLPSNNITAIVPSERGDMWLTSDTGILNFKLDGRTGLPVDKPITFDNFDQAFKDDSAAEIPGAGLFFGGSNGIVSFNPRKVTVDTVPPQVTITGFKLFNKEVPIGKTTEKQRALDKAIGRTEHLTLTHREDVLSIEFVGLKLDQSSDLSYAYRLKGFTDEWIYTDASQRVAHFTNLPYDTYRFEVKAANSNGYWSEVVGFNLTVLPPIWLTNWAKFFYCLLFLALLYAVRKFTKRRAELTHRLEIEQLETQKMHEVNEMKELFFTNISHELRTPLTLIISPLEELVRSTETKKGRHTTLTRMLSNANRLLAMINQLLDIRKHKSEMNPLKVAQTNLVDFTEEVFLSFKGLADREGIDLRLTTPEAPVPVWIDRNEMEKVLYNLLSNAVKFTPEKGTILIDISARSSSDILVTISDTGAGVKPEEQELVFGRFYQADSRSNRSNIEGTGIGLALAKDIVEKHHGEIWMESTVGRGSHFYIRLKEGVKHFLPEEISAGPPESEQVDSYLTAPVPVEAAPGDEPHTDGPLPKILLVEDNIDIRSYLREQLCRQYLIIEAENGEEGLARALKDAPDLIVADLAMPLMNGLELCEKIKSDLTTSHIPFILLTARTSLLYKVDGAEKGADDYITKPFNIQLLKARIKNLLLSREKLRAYFKSGFDFTPSELKISSLDEEFLNKIKSTVERNIENSDFSVEMLAKELVLSRMQLYRKVKSLTGKSPNAILRSVRLQRAAQLLKLGNHNVAEITYMVGYNDLKYFRETFKKEFSVSPSEYLRQQNELGK